MHKDLQLKMIQLIGENQKFSIKWENGCILYHSTGDFPADAVFFLW